MEKVKIEGEVPREFFNWFEDILNKESDLGTFRMLDKVNIREKE